MPVIKFGFFENDNNQNRILDAKGKVIEGLEPDHDPDQEMHSSLINRKKMLFKAKQTQIVTGIQDLLEEAIAEKNHEKIAILAQSMNMAMETLANSDILHDEE